MNSASGDNLPSDLPPNRRGRVAARWFGDQKVNEPRAGSTRDAGGGESGLAGLLFLKQAGPPSAEQLITVAAEAIPNSDHVCLTVAGTARGVQPVASSDELGPLLAALQARVDEGPGLEPVERNDLVHLPDLEADTRWPVFSRQARDLGIRSVVATRSALSPRGQVALTLYADRPDAFTADDLQTAMILGSFTGLTLEHDRQRTRAANLEVALETNRHIGTAIGILMARQMLTSEQAFQRLREVSQRQHRKLRDVAEDVARTGELAVDP
jgi:ANTAR domain